MKLGGNLLRFSASGLQEETMNTRAGMLALLMVSSLIFTGFCFAQEESAPEETSIIETETGLDTDITAEETPSEGEVALQALPEEEYALEEIKIPLILPPIPGEGVLAGDKALPPLPEIVKKEARASIKSNSGKLKGRYGIAYSFGYSDASFSGVNDFFDRANSYYDIPYYGHYDGGLQHYGEVFNCLTDDIRVSLGFGYFSDSFDIEVTGQSQIIGDENKQYNMERTLTTRVFPFSVNLGYYKEWIYGLRLFGAAGIALYHLDFSMDSWYERNSAIPDERFFEYDFGENGKRHWSGSSPGLQVRAGVEYFLNRNVAVEIMGEYRSVEIGQVENFNADPFLYIHDRNDTDYSDDTYDFDGDGSGKNQWTTGEAPVPFDLTGFSFGLNLKYFF